MSIERTGTIYQTQDMVLTLKQCEQVVGPIRYVSVLSATYRDDVWISFDGGSFFPIPPGIALAFDWSDCWIKNMNASANTIRVASGASDIRDNRLIIDALNPVTVTVTGTITSVGAAAHDAAVSGAPLLQGAEALSTERAAVNTGDATRLTADLVGKLVVAPYAQSDLAVRGNAQLAAAGVVDLIAAQAAGVRTHLTSLLIANDGGADNVAIILDGATEVYRIAVKAGASQQVSLPMPVPGTAATAWRFNITGATSMRAHASGFKGR
jgi:hypothetical protein